MATIVEQLQSQALDPSVPVSALLRRVKLVAVKLKLSSIEKWVELELTGYEQGSVPDYRRISGRPTAMNPYRGWVPIMGNPEFISAISEFPVAEPITSLESLLSNNGSTYYMPFTPHQVSMLNQGAGLMWADMGRDVSRGQITQIVERVRNLVLDWALELERQGILGTEVGFPDSEKILAQDKGVLIQIGSIEHFSGALNSNVEGESARVNISSYDGSRNRTGNG